MRFPLSGTIRSSAARTLRSGSIAAPSRAWRAASGSLHAGEDRPHHGTSTRSSAGSPSPRVRQVVAGQQLEVEGHRPGAVRVATSSIVSVAPGKSGPHPTEIVPAGSPCSPGPMTHRVHSWCRRASSRMRSLGANGASAAFAETVVPAQDELVDAIAGAAGDRHGEGARLAIDLRGDLGGHDARIGRPGKLEGQRRFGTGRRRRHGRRARGGRERRCARRRRAGRGRGRRRLGRLGRARAEHDERAEGDREARGARRSHHGSATTSSSSGSRFLMA